MRTTSAQYAKLLQYIDGTLTPAEKEALAQQLAQNKALRAKLTELQAAHAILKTSVTLEEPSRDFTLNVMENLYRTPAQAPTAPALSIRKSILLLAGALIAAVGTAILVGMGLFDAVTTTVDLNTIKPGDFIKETIPAVNINGRLLINMVIVVNIVIGWVVLDRTILKPWFQKRQNRILGDVRMDRIESV